MSFPWSFEHDLGNAILKYPQILEHIHCDFSSAFHMTKFHSSRDECDYT